MSEQVIEAEVVEESMAVAPVGQVAPSPSTLFRTDDPVAVLAAATETANALAPVLRQQNMTANIQGKDHVEIAGWQTLGAMLGVTAVGVWTRKCEGGWEAKVNAQTLDGRVIGSAEAMCVRKEDRWKDAEDYAIRSMAQTRAASKALASVLRFVVTLAGFSGTPAEEMDGVKSSGGPSSSSSGPSAKQLDFLKKLAGEAGFMGTDLEVLIDWAAAVLTGGKEGTCSDAIDGLMQKSTRTVVADRLGRAAKDWQAKQGSDLPPPDMTGLETATDLDPGEPIF